MRPTAPNDSAMECRNLAKTFVLPHARIEAIVDISLSVRPGEVFGLLGQNGSGKTTLMRLVSGVLLPTRGTAVVAGYDVCREPQRVRQSLGLMTGDERSFYGRLTGRQNLDLFAALYGLRRRPRARRVAELLDLFDLQRHADVPFQAYSAGTKQRLSMARALLHDPGVLLLDEPTRSMDVAMADAVHRLIADELVGRQGKTVLLASHDTREVETLCERVAIIKDGLVIACGAPSELAARTGNGADYEFQLSASAADDDFAWLGRQAHVLDVVAHRQRSGMVHLRVKVDAEHSDAVPEVWRRLAEAGCEIARCTCEKHSVRQTLSRLAELDADEGEPA